ncbi:hypothetical protein U1Q18_028616 [Sarracenia purpurea var. burkii]
MGILKPPIRGTEKLTGRRPTEAPRLKPKEEEAMTTRDTSRVRRSPTEIDDKERTEDEWRRRQNTMMMKMRR